MRWKRCVSAAIVAATLVVAGAAPQPQPAARARVIVLSLDAGADWIFDDLLSRGQAPAFSRMAEEGARADAMITVMPPLTAPSHASLWTGAWPRVHGISGNNVPLLPRAAHRVNESQSGFENYGLTAEPIWMAAVRQGRRALVAQATGAAPFTTEWTDRLLMFDTYAESLLPLELIEGDVAPASPFRKTIGDAELTVTASSAAAGQLDVALGAFRGALTPGTGGRFSSPIALTVGGRPAYTRLRLLAYSPDRRRFTLLRGRIDELMSNQPGRIADLRAAAGAIVGENVTRPYASGRFGPTRAARGNGDAEELLAQIIEVNNDYFTGIVNLAAGEPWDLLVLYVPSLDTAGHALVGMIDRDSPSYRPEVAAAIWPVFDRIVSRTVDPLAAMLRSRFPDATLLIGADHGMEGAHDYVYPNVALRKAGLLALAADGRIDVSRTSAMQLPSTAGAIYLNSTDWKDGIVPPARRAAVKRAAVAALLGIRDPKTGAAPVRAVFDSEIDGEALGIGGPAGADLYLDTAPGYIFSSSRLTGNTEVAPMGPAGSGEHGNAPWRRKLHAIFFAAGPQVDARTNPGIVRTIDVAPTVARLLGIDPPRNSIGRVIPLGPTTR